MIINVPMYLAGGWPSPPKPDSGIHCVLAGKALLLRRNRFICSVTFSHANLNTKGKHCTQTKAPKNNIYRQEYILSRK